MAADPSKQVVSPHAEGPAHLTFSPDGHYLYTCGYEGLTRIFDARLDADASVEPAILDFHEEAVTSLSASNEYLVSASETGQVVLHKAGTTELEGFLTRFSLPARSVRFDPRGKRAVVTSDEVIAKVIDVKDTTKVQILTGHSRSIREASWSPDGQFVTTSSVDGSIRVWQLDAGTEPTCVQVIDGLITAEDADSEYSVEVIWHPGSKFFVVPSRDNDIAVVSRESWQRTGSFTLKDGNKRVSSLAFSPNGLYLASASLEGDLLIWSVKDRNVVARTPHTHGLITSLAFHPAPTANSIAYIDNKGQLTRWANPIPSNLPAPTFSRAPTSAATSHNREASGPKTGGAAGRKRSDSASTSTSSHAAPAKGKNGGLFRDQASEDEFDDYNVDGLDGWIDDDLGDGLDGEAAADEKDPFADDLPLATRGLGRNLSLEPGRAGQSSEGYYSAPVQQRGQPPFQPGATPWREKRRYLAFNMIGFISAVDREDSQAITIDFHDRSAHIATKFDDKMRYDLGALGELGAVFSCPALDEHPSQIFYRPYESWTSLQTWSASLPAGEDATVLAIGGMGPPPGAFDDASVGLTGSGTILVATSRGFVRFFSGAGLQKYLWNVGEEVVTMAAGKDWAVVVHRASVGGAGLEYALIDTDTFEIVQQGKVPLQKGVTLSWIGFTDDNIPVMFDSKGLLSILDRSRRPRQARWVPALDTSSLARKEGKQEAYWPVGVTEQQAHVVILKGGEQYPHFPTPLLQELDLQFPLVSLDIPQGQLAEKFLRGSLFVQHRKDGAPADDYTLKAALAREELLSDKHMLQIVQTFCKADRLEAALDAVLLLSQTASLVAASKIAGFFTSPALQERIDLIQQLKEDAGDPEVAAAKRESKWAHLADDRYITSNAPVGGARGGAAYAASSATADLFAPRPVGTPGFGSSARRSFGTPMSTGLTPSAAKKRRSVGRESIGPSRLDSGFGGSDGAEMLDGGDDSVMLHDEGADDLGSSPKRMRDESEEAQVEEDEIAPPPPKKAVNPFAKRPAAAKPAPSPAANPFADKKAGKAKDLGRTDSFFHRVEGKEAPKAKGKGKASISSSKSKAASDGMQQTTIFGAKPPAPKPDAPRPSKKRKSVSTAEEQTTEASPAADETSTSGSTNSKLEAFRLKAKPAPTSQSTAKAGSAATAGLGGAEGARELPREGEEMEETQVVDETQEESLGAERRASELEVVREETEPPVERADETQGEDADTQMTDTQVVVDEDPMSTKENRRPASLDPTASKPTSFEKRGSVEPDAAESVAADAAEVATA
ncbi:chromatin-binding protein CTF4 [Rhodotorula paludigena]|uniref:chromatin-binding protein CTF4 n=1 Tax=Rhodotorula paludigena TaxID=86838 RepID=UPI00316B47B6